MYLYNVSVLQKRLQGLRGSGQYTITELLITIILIFIIAMIVSPLPNPYFARVNKHY